VTVKRRERLTRTSFTGTSNPYWDTYTRTRVNVNMFFYYSCSFIHLYLFLSPVLSFLHTALVFQWLLYNLQ